MRFYCRFTLLVRLHWSRQPKRVSCELLLLRTVNCRPTTFHSTTALQSTAKYCNSKATTFIFWRFPSQTHYRIQAIRTYWGFSQSHNANAEIFPNRNHGRTLLYFPPTMVFPSHSMLYHTFSWNKVITNSKNQPAILTLINKLTEWIKMKRVDKL